MRRRRFEVDGTPWVVFDVVPDSSLPLGPTLKQGWLCFESHVERRRLSPIPEGWEEFSPAELATQLSMAKPLRR